VALRGAKGRASRQLLRTITDTQYAYDQAGELKTVTVSTLDGQTLTPPLVTAYSYDLNSNLVSTQNANGTTEARTYNSLNELTSIVDTNSSGVYASFAYTYDLAGHVLTETDLDGRTDTYSYDNLYRLTEESISDPSTGSRTLTWTYDLVGNRVESTDTGAPAEQKGHATRKPR
jgi:YD repeat-containing protein